MLRCLSKRAAAAHAHSTQPVDGPKHAEVLPTLPPAAELVQPPLRANLPNAGIVRGGEHGSFTRGDEAISSMKGCSLCMLLRCVAPTRRIAREVCSTLPARRVDLSKFSRAEKRMYLLCFNALSVLHQTLSGRFCTLYRIYPCDRHGRTVPRQASKGTRACTSRGRRKGVASGRSEFLQ